MKTIESLKLLSVWAEPDFPVRAAKMLLDGYSVAALPVCQSGQLLGMVTTMGLAKASDDDKVRDFMTPPAATVSAGSQVRSVVDTFIKNQVSFAPVVQDSRSMGMVTAWMLMSELTRSLDPLTGLSWADYLREWGVEQLSGGREVTILFVDLDDFGQYNKLYGHVVGDKVIKAVSSLLERSLDPSRDILVRYGGDEFAIGTLRNRSEAEEFAAQLEEDERTVVVPESPKAVTFSIGVFGGKRGKDRPNEHYQSVLDNLINLASKAAQERKRAKKDPPAAEVRVSDIVQPPVAEPMVPALAVVGASDEVPPVELAEAAPLEPVASAPSEVAPPPSVAPAPAVSVTPRSVRIVEVMADEHGANPMIAVSLAHGDRVVNGVSALSGGSVSHAVATATAKALERAFSGDTVQIQDVRLTNGPDGKRQVAVDMRVVTEHGTRSGSGTAMVGDEIGSSVAEAALDAFFAAA